MAEAVGSLTALKMRLSLVRFQPIPLRLSIRVMSWIGRRVDRPLSKVALVWGSQANPPWFSASGPGCESQYQYSLMDKSPNTMRFLVIGDLFPGYTIMVSMSDDKTSVYCESCDQWVARWDGDKLSRHQPHELLELIVETHREQMYGPEVEIADGTENFI